MGCCRTREISHSLGASLWMQPAAPSTHPDTAKIQLQAGVARIKHRLTDGACIHCSQKTGLVKTHIRDVHRRVLGSKPHAQSFETPPVITLVKAQSTSLNGQTWEGQSCAATPCNGVG